MRGLLLKDTYVVLKQAKVYLFLMLVFALIPVGGMFSYAICFAAILPVTALAYDERAKWDRYAAAMPYSVRDIVRSKYVFGYFLTFLMTLIAIITRGIKAAVLGKSGLAEMLMIICIICCVALLMLTINLPIMFKFGVEKGRLFYMVPVIVALVGSYTFADSAVEDGLLTAGRELSIISAGNVLALIVITVVLNILSIKLSEKLYAGNKR